MKKNFLVSGFVLRSIIAGCSIAALILSVNSCTKNKSNTSAQASLSGDAVAVSPYKQGNSQECVLTIAAIRPQAGGAYQVLFHQKQEIFNTSDSKLIATLQNALSNNKAVKVTVDPWGGQVQQAALATAEEAQKVALRGTTSTPSIPVSINMSTINISRLDDMNGQNVLAGLMPIDNTTSNLVSMVPDMATAQLMFNYITKQCCALAGPYAIDYCISFQYCEDGCYARAHKMCNIINTKFNYATQKIFSFANTGSDQLCVKGEKWGGCCVNWWYHVAPLLTIKTPTGPKAFVFDPAMFDQPVLLSTWLHAQENPACAGSSSVPHVSMINVQPTSSYGPATYAGTTFDTDPYFADTDSTLVHYSVLTTCP